jgi:O-antigen ligase
MKLQRIRQVLTTPPPFLLITAILALLAITILASAALFHPLPVNTIEIILLICGITVFIIPMSKSLMLLKSGKGMLLELGMGIQLFALLIDTSLVIYATAIFAICTITYFLLHNDKRIKCHYLPVSLFLFGFFALRVIGIAWIDDKTGVFSDIEHSISFLLLPLLFSLVRFSEATTRRLTVFFIRCAFIYCLLSLLKGVYSAAVLDIALLDWLKESKQYHPLITQWFARDMHPTFIAMALVSACIAAVYAGLKKHISWIEYGLLAMLSLLYILLSGSRMGLVVFLLSGWLSFLLFTTLGIRKKIFLGIASIAVISIAFFTIKTNSTNIHDPIRSHFRQSGIAMIKERPLFGHGTGSYKIGYEQSVNNALQNGQPEKICNNCFHLHNQYIDEAIQYGISGLTLFVGGLLFILYWAWRKRNYVLLLFVLTQMLHMVSDSPLLMQREITLFTVMLCFLALPWFQIPSGNTQQSLE